MPNRFVILEHDHPTLHWDLMLEFGAVLRTWRLPEPPRPGLMSAEPLPDHRLLYLDYEGPLSGNRGAVKRWDAGTFELVAESAQGLEVSLRGRRIEFVAHLQRTGPTLWTIVWQESSESD